MIAPKFVSSPLDDEEVETARQTIHSAPVLFTDSFRWLLIREDVANSRHQAPGSDCGSGLSAVDGGTQDVEDSTRDYPAEGRPLGTEESTGSMFFEVDSTSSQTDERVSLDYENGSTVVADLGSQLDGFPKPTVESDTSTSS
jgi:hypothetical protein